MAEMLLDMEPSDMASPPSYLTTRSVGRAEVMGRGAGPLQLYAGAR